MFSQPIDSVQLAVHNLFCATELAPCAAALVLFLLLAALELCVMT